MLILSERSGKVYETNVLDGCTCPYWQKRHRSCRHMRALSEYYRAQAAQKESTHG